MLRVTVFLGLLFSSVAYGYEPTLIGGREVQEGEYPEVVRIKSCEGQRCATCSASIIGKRVVLTAGHCMYTDQIKFMLGQNEYEAKCTAHPLYPDTEDMDMALCKTNRDMNVKFAHVSKKGPEIGNTVTLIGYGCTRPGGGGGNDGILRVGEADVTRLPTDQPVNNWYYTKADTALCFGDSGGPSFKRVEDPKGETHYVLGVNSRGNIRDLSLLTAIYLEKGVKFMEDYEREERVKICGLSARCGEQQEEPDRRCWYQKRKLDRYKEKVEKWQRRYDECRLESESLRDEFFFNLPHID